MDFLERLFNLSPDGGNGLTETTLVVSLALAGALGWMFRRLRNAARRNDTTYR